VEHLLNAFDADGQVTGLALLEAARAVFMFAANWAKEDITPKWALSTGSSVSLHLPLHRTAAAFAAAVAACDQRVTAAAATSTPSLLQQLLSGAARSHAVTLAEHWIRALAFMSQVRWCAPWPRLGSTGLEALRCGALLWSIVSGIRTYCGFNMAQVRARMWLRNGDELLRLERVYHSNIWRGSSLDLDIFGLQLAAAVVPDADAFVRRVLEVFEVESLQSNEAMGPFVDAMQLLVLLVRERSLIALDEKARVRREVLHW